MGLASQCALSAQPFVAPGPLLNKVALESHSCANLSFFARLMAIPSNRSLDPGFEAALDNLPAQASDRDKPRYTSPELRCGFNP